MQNPYVAALGFPFHVPIYIGQSYIFNTVQHPLQQRLFDLAEKKPAHRWFTDY